MDMISRNLSHGNHQHISAKTMFHIGETTVTENLDFSARCQRGRDTIGILSSELARREKDAGIFPEAQVDLFMKVNAKLATN
ncbi:ABC transporter G family member 35 [Populus alba x Populus x berolinensis]|uniref:ABC transporter G family member 35 n=1 Tax=Populus alba x Populus x berolinensis TaxID=444605 RepID=A0AAD6RUY7_9ROSI|nr:ABC transporter G family member 35 [Populus alba x Populus x berolinensis]